MKYLYLVGAILACIAASIFIGKVIKWLAIVAVLVIGGAWLYKKKLKPIFGRNM